MIHTECFMSGDPYKGAEHTAGVKATQIYYSAWTGTVHMKYWHFPHKGQWRGALIFTLICTWTNGWVNNRYAGDSKRHCTYHDVTVIFDVPVINSVIQCILGVPRGLHLSHLTVPGPHWARMSESRSYPSRDRPVISRNKKLNSQGILCVCLPSTSDMGNGHQICFTINMRARAAVSWTYVCKNFKSEDLLYSNFTLQNTVSSG